jgi:hypothetical protein
MQGGVVLAHSHELMLPSYKRVMHPLMKCDEGVHVDTACILLLI